MQQSFEQFLAELSETNRTLGFYCNFEKITAHVERIRVKLCTLSSLIGSTDIRRTVEIIWESDKSAFDVLPILIAVRDGKNEKLIDDCCNIVTLDSTIKDVDGILNFIDKTGLGQLFTDRRVSNLVDYVFGVETGLDTNARKNRSGKAMEQAVAQIIAKAGIDFEEQVSCDTWPEVKNALGKDKKVFDFVICRKQITYLIEVNYYSTGGSKPNEVTRSYSDIAPKINALPGFEFIWITDGLGWHNAKNKLQEAYFNIPRVYNLTSISTFLAELKQ